MDENVAMAAVSPARATAPHWTMYTARSHGNHTHQLVNAGGSGSRRTCVALNLQPQKRILE